MMADEQKKKNGLLKNTLIVAAALTVPLTGVNIFAYLAYDGQSINRKNFSNWSARKIGSVIETDAELLGLPEQGEVFISGRCDRYANFAAAAYTDEGKTTYLYGDETTPLTAYWTVRIQDGKAQEMWYSNHQLTEDELHPYTHEMQRDSMRFVPLPLPHSWIDDRALVGYWVRSETDNTERTDQ